jgi:hypothetical protein
MKGSISRFPKKKDGEDIYHLILKASASAIPVIGGPVSEIFNAVIAPSLERRREEWFELVGKDLAKIKKRVERLEKEGRAEKFVTVFIKSTQIALRTHQKEKLEALRASIYNVANEIDIEEDLTLMFLVLIEDLTPSHIPILKYFNSRQDRISYEDPTKDNSVLKDWNFQDDRYDSMAKAVSNRISGLGNSGFVKEILKDLLSRNLLEDQIEENFPLRSSYRSRIPFPGENKEKHREVGLSSLGKKFLSFIEK